ncbi:60s ribosomal protein [Porites harrisoni]
MAKRTKKIGVVGSMAQDSAPGVGESAKWFFKKMEIIQHSKYTYVFCRKEALKRECVGIWHCKGCGKTIAGGVWLVSTTAAVTIRSADMQR